MYNGKKVIHIVARGLNGEIGANNKLLWSIPEDLRFFKESTIGHVVLMGRNTVESLPKPLSRRVILEVTSKRNKMCGGKLISFEVLYENLNIGAEESEKLKTDKIFIAGGAKLYNSTFDIVDELWVTQVDGYYPEADTFYHIPKGFEMVDERNGDPFLYSTDVGYRFQKWVKVE